MTTKISTKDNVTTLQVEGHMDTLCAKQFEKDIAPILQNTAPQIDVDLSQLEYICSSGLRVFIILLKHVSQYKGQMTLHNMRPEVKEVFDLTGFSNIFSIV